MYYNWSCYVGRLILQRKPFSTVISRLMCAVDLIMYDMQICCISWWL